MKITAIAEVKKEVFEKYPDILRKSLITNISKELLNHKAFINPPVRERENGSVLIETHFYVLSPSALLDLEELAEKYPEIKKILVDIVVNP